MHENVPVRFGRGRLDSLDIEGLAAYLIARFCLPTGHLNDRSQNHYHFPLGLI